MRREQEEEEEEAALAALSREHLTEHPPHLQQHHLRGLHSHRRLQWKHQDECQRIEADDSRALVWKAAVTNSQNFENTETAN